MMDIEVKIYDALASTRLHVIGDKQTTSLSPDQKQQLLLVRFAASQNDSESAVSINFVDYATGVPVASCIGKYGLGLTKNNDMKVALDKAIQQIKYLFD